VDGKIVDVDKVTTGFRQTEFKGGAGTGGVYLNGKFVYLKGFAQRASNEWAGLGQAYPDWMHEFQAQLIRDSHANYVRWMHIAPQRVDSDTADRFGIIQICPGGRQGTGRGGTPMGAATGSDARHHHLLPQLAQHPFLGGGQTPW